jgi:hypothetical protein
VVPLQFHDAGEKGTDHCIIVHDQDRGLGWNTP